MLTCCMSRKNLALTMITAGTIIFFMPIVQQISNDAGQLTGAVFAVGGAILFYLPGSSSGKKR